MSGVKIAKTGDNVLTTADKDLAFNSAYNIFKVIKEGIENANYIANSGSITITIPHGLNFTPQFLAFVDSLTTPKKYFGLGQVAFVNSDGNNIGLGGYVDTTNLTIIVSVDSFFSSLYGSDQTFPVKYFIFADTTREIDTQTSFPSPLVSSGFKVAKPGKDINSPYIEDYIIHSQMPSMKVHLKGSTNITGAGLLTIAHGLDFPPGFLAMVSYDQLEYFLMYYHAAVDGPTNYAFSDSTNLYIRSFNAPGVTVYYKYIIFANRVDQ